MTDTKPCPWCDGSGKRANTPGREPWTVWMNLPLKSAMAVTMGVVRPVECDMCEGSGVQPAGVGGSSPDVVIVDDPPVVVPPCTSTAGNGAHKCALARHTTMTIHRADDGHFWSDTMSDQAIAKMTPEGQALAQKLLKITDGPPSNPHDPVTLPDKIRAKIESVGQDGWGVDWVAALQSVLDLQMPTWDRDPDEDDSDYRAGMTDGWVTCHAAAIAAIGTALGVDTDG